MKPDLLKIIACPECKGPVREQGMFLTCAACRLAYPVLDGDVPDMLVEDAWSVRKAEQARFRHRLRL